MRIYISGAISGCGNYKERFEKAEQALRADGHNVINPAKVTADMPESTYLDYINVTLSLLKTCNSIYMLEGWENSKGARLEHAYAECAEMTIIYEKDVEKMKEKKYYWELKIPSSYGRNYLNYNEVKNYIFISDKIEMKKIKAKFTKSEYKELSKRFNFPEDVFVKEEIE